MTTLKSGLNVDLTEKILLVSMCRFSIESVEHPRASNNVAAHTTPMSFLTIDIGAIYEATTSVWEHPATHLGRHTDATPLVSRYDFIRQVSEHHRRGRPT